MKKLLLSLSFSIAFVYMLFTPVSAISVNLNNGQIIDDVYLIDLVNDLNVLKPNFIDNYLYVIYHYDNFSYYVYLIPKINNYAYILGNNILNTDPYDIDSWLLKFDYPTNPAKLYIYNKSTKNIQFNSNLYSLNIDITNKLYYSNVNTVTYFSYYDGLNFNGTIPIDPTIFGYTSIPSNILNGNFNEFNSGSFFDFIVSFDNWLSKSLNNLIYTEPYLDDYGSVYDYKQNGFIKFGVYLLFVIAFVVTITFVLGFVKSAYYFVKEIF